MVEELWRYLLKSAQGESLPSLTLDAEGPAGDRSWACLDPDDIVVSAKHPRRWGRLLEVRAWAAGAEMMVEVPGGRAERAGSAEADAALSGWLGAPVRLSRTVPPGARLHRLFPREDGMRPSWSADLPEDTVTPIIGGRFVDYAPVHVVTTADLAQLLADGAPDTEPRRFRPNLVLSLDQPLRPGDHVRFSGGVQLRVTLPTPRCAVPGAAQPGIAAAPGVLRAIGSRRTELPGIGTAACVGVYAEVLRPGVIRTGERVSV